jgi:hypothetical protein
VNTDETNVLRKSKRDAEMNALNTNAVELRSETKVQLAASLTLIECSFMLRVFALIATKSTTNRSAHDADQHRSATSAVGSQRPSDVYVRGP